VRKILLDYLKSCTKEKPLNRYEAAEKLNTTERTIRGLITVLRTEGIRVCSDSSGRGYWIAESEEDYKRFRAEYVSRASNIFRTVNAMDNATEGQIGGLT
jgi:predicted ArsR family transcriptional regulator